VGHPSLGEPPRDETAGFPADAARLLDDRARIGRRAVEVAIDRDPSLRERHGEAGLTRLFRDTEIFIDRLARSIAADDDYFTREFADWVAPIYRRRRVPMDDLVTLSEGIRQATAALLAPAARQVADRAIDAAIVVFRRHRRLAGDARRRNRLLAFIYKGA
jgi:hypothetical protein